MKTKVRTTYNCDYCNKLYLRKDAAEKHEISCWKNPANERPCFGCSNLCKKKATVYTGVDNYHSGEPETMVAELMHCKEFGKFLYTPQNEIKGNWFEMEDFGGYENVAMPKTCNRFTSELLEF